MGARLVFLVGFMAAGKTTIGRELARRQGWDFIDLDASVEERAQQSVTEVFRTQGEHEFRRLETDALRDLTSSSTGNHVVALGGGTFTLPCNQELVKPWPSVFLKTSVEELWRRCLDDSTQRPLRSKTLPQFADLYQQRLPSYNLATTVIETGGKDLASICSEIEAALDLNSQPFDTPAQPNLSSETGGSR
jgi:shikimate kinase